MLEFVGLGLYDTHSITERGAAAVAAADHVCLEGYTSVLAGASVDELAAHHDRDIEVLERADLERHPGPLLDRAERDHVVILVGGDPMVATTHVDLRLRAIERGIETAVVHGTSAATAAAGLCGLQARRFGKATTIPAPGHFGDDGVPPSVLETIDDNRERGLHTLAYLDIDLGDGAIGGGDDHRSLLADRCLDATRAASALAASRPELLAVVVARAGSDDPQVEADTVSMLADRAFGPPLHLLVVPGRLHELEAEALCRLADAPREHVEDLVH